MSTVPFVDFRAQAPDLHDEFTQVFESVISRPAYTMGPECARLVRTSVHLAALQRGLDMRPGWSRRPLVVVS